MSGSGMLANEEFKSRTGSDPSTSLTDSRECSPKLIRYAEYVRDLSLYPRCFLWEYCHLLARDVLGMERKGYLRFLFQDHYGWYFGTPELERTFGVKVWVPLFRVQDESSPFRSFFSGDPLVSYRRCRPKLRRASGCEDPEERAS